MAEEEKTSKVSLPREWTVRQSRTYPDRFYYFNVVTGEATWKKPKLCQSDEEDEEKIVQSPSKGRKRTIGSSDSECTPFTITFPKGGTEKKDRESGRIKRKELRTREEKRQQRCSPDAASHHKWMSKGKKVSVVRPTQDFSEAKPRGTLEIHPTQDVIKPNTKEPAAKTAQVNDQKDSGKKSEDLIIGNSKVSFVLSPRKTKLVSYTCSSSDEDDSEIEKKSLPKKGKKVRSLNVPHSNVITGKISKKTSQRKNDINKVLKDKTASKILKSDESCTSRLIPLAGTKHGKDSEQLYSESATGRKSGKCHSERKTLKISKGTDRQNERETDTVKQKYLSGRPRRETHNLLLNNEEREDSSPGTQSVVPDRTVVTKSALADKITLIYAAANTTHVLPDRPALLHATAFVNSVLPPTTKNPDQHTVEATEIGARLMSPLPSEIQNDLYQKTTVSPKGFPRCAAQEVAMEVEDGCGAVRQEEDMMIDVTMMVQEVRKDLNPDPGQTTGFLTEGLYNAPIPDQTTYKKLLIILDTNILLSSIKFVDELKDQQFEGLGRPTLVIPWIVLQELDAIKDMKGSNSAEALQRCCLAQDPVKYLYNIFASKHPRVIGQTPQQASRPIGGLEVQCNDDRVLQCVLHTQEQYTSAYVILLTEDKHLISKATVMNIVAYTKEKLIDWLKDRHIIRSLKAPKEDFEKAVFSAKKQAERELADEVLCEVKTVLREGLSVVLETEMKLVYGDLWLHVVYKKPPWTLRDIIDCFQKHWIAVFGMIIPRSNQTKVNNLADHFKPGQEFGRTVRQAYSLLENAITLCGALREHASYKGRLEVAVERLQELEKVCKGVLEDKYPISSLAELEGLAGHSSLPASSISGSGAEPSQNCSMHVLMPDEQVAIQTRFQTTWEAINRYCGLLEETLCGNQHNRATAELPNRAEAVHFLINLYPYVLQIKSAYESMLNMTPAVARCRLDVFKQLCQALHQFTLNTPGLVPGEPMHAEHLQAFFLEDQRREVLQNGFIQLSQWLVILNRCIGTMTLEEQIGLQSQLPGSVCRGNS